MTSATGSNPARKRAGFTLVEIVFALGIMAIAAAVVAVNVVSMIDKGKTLSADEVLFVAIQEARFIAAADRKVTELRFNQEKGSLEIRNSLGEKDSYSLGEAFTEKGRSSINFYLVPPAEGLAPHSDPLRASLKSNVVRFAPDRSSSPFVIEIDSGRGTPAKIAIDPFSSLERQIAK